ncbi:MAG TPA: tetratricopeptide repeat protein [Bacteroidia bacterium]|jgi:tetratricopeptide (TPR) repeat protein|nr:tetratricopeptide repeat protein [Bacteroidia bacterium]
MKKSFCFILLIFISQISISQNKKSDSLWAVYNDKTQADTNRLKAINNIAIAYIFNSPDTAIICAEKQLMFARQSKQKKYEAGALKTISIALTYKGNYPKALDYSLKSLKLYEEIADKKGIGNCYINIGSIYDDQSNSIKALEFYLKSLKIREEIRDKKGIAACYTNIGVVYFRQTNYPKALEYYLEALKIAEETKDTDTRVNCYDNIGIIYANQSDYPKALEYCFKNVKLREEINDKIGMGASYDNIGNIYYRQANYPEALKYFFKSLQIKEVIGDKQGLGICYGNLSGLYNDLSNYKIAIKYSNSALQISKEIGDIDIERLSYEHLADIYAKMKKYKEAYESHVKFKQLTDSIFNSENSKQLGDMKTQFEVDKKEAELKIKAKAQEAISAEEKKKQQIIIYAVAGVLILVAVFSVFLYNRFRITNKQKKIIEEQKILVDKAYESLHEKNKEVMDSIYYARRIQTALMKSEKTIGGQLNRLIE